MASALVQVNVIDSAKVPLYSLLLHSSNINMVRGIDSTSSFLSFFDPSDQMLKQVIISQDVAFMAIQSGMMSVTAINIDGTDLENETIAIQEFSIISVRDDSTYRTIQYNDKGNIVRFIRVLETLENLKNQTSQSGASVGASISPSTSTIVANSRPITSLSSSFDLT